VLDLLRQQTNQQRPIIKRMAATPPATPPAIAAVFGDDRSVLVGDGGYIVTEYPVPV